VAQDDFSATLHGNAIFGKSDENTLVLPFTSAPAESSRERMASRSQNAKRTPRCMRASVFQKNERHAAWERWLAQP
jgi:hypothetical protein